MTNTRFFKLLLAPVLAGFILWPSVVHGQAVLKPTVSEVLTEPAKYEGQKLELSGIVMGFRTIQVNGKTITSITLGIDPAAATAAAPAAAVPNAIPNAIPNEVSQAPKGTLRISFPGKLNLAKGDTHLSCS